MSIRRRKIFWLVIINILLYVCVTETPFAAGQRGEVLEVKVVKVSIPPVLDGKLDDKTWLSSALYGSKLSGFVDSTNTKLIDYQPVVFIAYDNDNLYLAAKCYIPEISKLRGDSKLFSWDVDDLIQIFLEPKLNGRYVQYGINYKGIKTNDRINVATSIGKIYWILELSISWKDLQIIPKEGMLIGFNICGQQQGEWITWSPTYGSFHNPDRFGYLILGSKLSINKIPTTTEEDNF